MKMTDSRIQKITVELGERSYHINIGENIFDIIPRELKQLHISRQVVVISVPPVSDLYFETLNEQLSEDFDVIHYNVPDGEQSKSAGIVELLYDWLLENNIERSASIIALGGGVVGDLAGFVAATFLRGINLIHIPTSLLAQVDSSIGGKVGINHRTGKNLIGAFYQPRNIFTDISVLQTLPAEEYICGLGEVVKYGVIGDPQLFSMLEANIENILTKDANVLRAVVLKCASQKAEIVSRDERESGLRAILNYGHTFAHSLEAYYGYSGLKHGQAVLLGMICANYAAAKLKILPVSEQERIDSLIMKMPLSLPANESPPDPDNLLALMYKDKKVEDGQIRLILASKIGHAQSHQVMDENLIKESFEYLFSLHPVKSVDK